MGLYKHFKVNPMLRYITVILFIVSTTVKADLTANYDKPESAEKYFDVEEKELTLKCTGATSKLQWAKNLTDINNVEILKDEHGSRFELKGDLLIIRRITVEDEGRYTCSSDGKLLEINVVANAFPKKIPEHMSAVEGEKLKITCKVFGTDPEIMWRVSYGDNTNNFEPVPIDRVQFQEFENVPNAILIINPVQMSDRGQYNCTVRNKATAFNEKKYPESTSGTFVRVKGKLAALWPFLGICAEVLILCAIILVYEKRRNKEGMDESDTDQSPEQEKLKTGK